MGDPFPASTPSGFDDPLIPFDDPSTGFDGTAGPPELPVVTGVSPNSGPDSGGTLVTVTGLHFGGPPGGRFGHNDSGWSIPIWEITPDVDGVLDLIEASGAKSLRTDGYWALLQPDNPENADPGENDTLDTDAIADLDAVHAGCVARGIHLVICVGYTAEWARLDPDGIPYSGSGDDDKIPPTHPEDYGHIGKLLAERYAVGTVSFEIWNEANISNFWKQPAATSTLPGVDWTPDAIHYSACLTSFYDEIKAVDPGILVITSGMSPATGEGEGANYSPAAFLLNILIYARDKFDHVGHHPYIWEDLPDGTESWNPMAQIADLMWPLLQLYSRTDADFWGTECGIISRPDISGSDPASETPGGIVGIEGYVTGAPGPGYNTAERAIDYTLGATRAGQIKDAWRDHYDTTEGRYYTGPLFIFKLQQTASPTDWTGSDEEHFGAYEQDGTHTAVSDAWEAMFADPNGAAATTTTVTVGGIAATIESITDTQIILTTPAHTAGTVDVVVTTPAGSSTTSSSSRYTFTAVGLPGAPVITGLAPSAGPAAGGTIVTASGTDFSFVDAAYFGDTPADILPGQTDTSIDLRAPAHAVGPVDVTLRNPSGTSSPGPASVYTYLPPRPRKRHEWVILARDGQNRPRAQIEDYPTFTFVRRRFDVGAHQFEIPISSRAVPTLLGPRAGVIVLCNDEPVYSGPTRSKLRQDRDGSSKLISSGVDDNFWLTARVAHPEPDLATPDANGHYGPNVYDTRTGVCSTVLSEYVRVNLGINAVARRRIPELTVAPDPGIGSVVTGNGRWQPLLELLRRKAIESDPSVLFRILQDDQALVFSCSEPVDRTRSAVFSVPSGTLGDFEYERAGATANYIYALGAGAEAARLVAEAENGTDVAEWGLIETATDHRDIGGVATLRQTAVSEVLEQAGIFRTDLSVIDTNGVEWRKDYDLGDRVTVVIDGVQVPELVREIKLELGTGDTEKITASVSSPSRKATVRASAVFALLRSYEERLSNLERN